MQILVLGATSFVGQAVSARMVEVGLRVRACHTGPIPQSAPRKADWVKVDERDTASLEAAATGCDAAVDIAELPASGQRLAEALREGVPRQRRVLAAARSARVRRFIFSSSACTMGPGSAPASEAREHLPTGEDLCADLMLALEGEVLASNSLLMTTSVLLPTLPCGPGQAREGINALLRSLRAGHLPALPAARANLVDVRDLAQAHLTAVQRARPGQRYALGAAAAVTLKEVAAEVARTGAARSPVFVPAGLADRWIRAAAPALRRSSRASALLDLMALMSATPEEVDTSKAKLELNFDPRHPMVTVKDTLAWLESEGH